VGVDSLALYSQEIYVVRLLIICVAGIFFSACSDEARAEDTLELKVLYSSAVTGSLEKGSHSYSPGQTVSYSFSLAKGFKDLRVVIDGKPAPSSGTISITKDHYLWAYASVVSGTALKKVITVPTDVTSIPYPEFYKKQPAAQVIVKDPFCTLASDTVSFPASYLGQFPFPEINGAPLPYSIRRGVGIKDYWQNWMTNPSGVLYPPQGPNGWLSSFQNEKRPCDVENGLFKAYESSLKRIKRLGADHVNLYPAFGLIEGSNPAAGINPAPGGGGISQSDLKKLILLAKAQGLRVWLAQWQLIASNDNIVPPSKPSREWIASFFSAYRTFIVDQARFAQANGVEAFDICAGFGISGGIDWSQGEDIFISNMIAISKKVRAVYSGKIIFGAWNSNIRNTLLKNQIFRKSIDLMYEEAGASFPSVGYAQSVSVESIKKQLSEFYTGYVNYMNYSGIDPSTLPPIVYVIQENSFYSALENGSPFVDDSSGCSSDGKGDCLQNSIGTDFSVQAIYNEALLEFLATQNYVPIYSIDPKFYWHTDTITPVPCNNLKAVCGFFPNISTSIRNKPSEVIFYHWFKKP
jgi:hypothetical protein